MSNALERLSAPSAEPVSLAEIKAHIRLELNDDDILLAGLIVAAREWVEAYTAMAILPQNWRFWLDHWPAERPLVVLPKAPVQSITQIVVYAANDSSSLWSAGNYLLDNASRPARIILRDSQNWPMAGRLYRGIAIDFVAGYSTATAVPEQLKLAIKQLVAHWYEHRGDEAGSPTIPQPILGLLSSYRVVSL